MPMIYRVKHDGEDERASTFFAKQGEANKFRRDNKDKSPDKAEKIKIQGRDQLCALLNDPHGFDPDGNGADEDNEFI